jgi:hypothetical protein
MTSVSFSFKRQRIADILIDCSRLDTTCSERRSCERWFGTHGAMDTSRMHRLDNILALPS